MAEGPPQETVIVIDDDYAMRLSCAKILTKMGLASEVFEDGARGLAGVAASKPALVIVDLKMPGISGMEVIGRVHEIDPEIVIVVITGYATIDTAVQAMQCGAYDFLPKPFSPDELRLIVRRGLERRRLAVEARRHEIEQTMLKRRFVTFVSHQLRAPLAAVHQYLDVMQRLDEAPDAAARRREWLERCLARIEELQRLIADWLTLARVEGGALVQERIKVDLHDVICPILRTYREAAVAEDVALDATLPADRFFVPGDRNCLSVLFDNLITNAIKYNRPGGRVTVSAAHSPGQVTVAVADTGIGIEDRHRPFLFDEFFRGGGAGMKKTSGTGLGLHISRKIAVEMGGTIDFESKAGAGSTFYVRLPAWGEPESADGGDEDGRRKANTHS